MKMRPLFFAAIRRLRLGTLCRGFRNYARNDRSFLIWIKGDWGRARIISFAPLNCDRRIQAYNDCVDWIERRDAQCAHLHIDARGAAISVRIALSLDSRNDFRTLPTGW